jgi:hypothetical protein
MFMLPHARVVQRRAAHNVNFCVARTFTFRRKFVRRIFTFNTQQKYMLMWTRLNRLFELFPIHNAHVRLIGKKI